MKSLPQHRKLITDFCQMTSASQSQAQHFLTKTSYNFQNAINLFFDEGTVPEKKSLEHTKEIDQLFVRLSNETGNGVRQIDEEKFAQFVDSFLQVDEESLIIPHVLLNVMKVPKSGHVTIEQFYALFQYLGCESPGQLAKHVNSLHQQIYHNKQNFKNMYMTTYGFYLCGKDTTLEYDLAVQIWKLYLKQVMTCYQQFIEYCESCSKKYKKVHKDLWRMVYEFATTVMSINDVKEDDGWPVFLDEFVQWVKAKQAMKQQATI